ncbi:MAG: DUF2852 domain-containing protein [Tabrizicola sp.]|nr:DUF2852 domain-containing protein [Tabrizicola sp.]
MYTTTDTARPGGIRSALGRAEDWLDAKGKKAWIAAMVLGFIFFWPVGLALLAYMIWGKRMFGHSCSHRRNSDHHSGHHWDRHAFRAGQSTGNHAFDAYKVEALRRLEDEQKAFEDFLQRLRNSKDKTEFDAFMEDRARSTAAQDAAESAESKPDTSARPGEY